jgi:hypothetical protein
VCRTRLAQVLALGNYLNGGTAQGGVYGVKLDVLLKVMTWCHIQYMLNDLVLRIKCA